MNLDPRHDAKQTTTPLPASNFSKYNICPRRSRRLKSFVSFFIIVCQPSTLLHARKMVHVSGCQREGERPCDDPSFTPRLLLPWWQLGNRTVTKMLPKNCRHRFRAEKRQKSSDETLQIIFTPGTDEYILMKITTI